MVTPTIFGPLVLQSWLSQCGQWALAINNLWLQASIWRAAYHQTRVVLQKLMLPFDWYHLVHRKSTPTKVTMWSIISSLLCQHASTILVMLTITSWHCPQNVTAMGSKWSVIIFKFLRFSFCQYLPWIHCQCYCQCCYNDVVSTWSVEQLNLNKLREEQTHQLWGSWMQ